MAGLKAVLIPFPEHNSKDHLISTKGGLVLDLTASDEIKRELNAVIEKYERLKGGKFSSRIDNDIPGWFPDPEDQSFIKDYVQFLAVTSGLDNKTRDFKLGTLLLKHSARQRQAERKRKTFQGWKGVDPKNVVCADSPSLHSVLEALAGPDDVLYIRGHGSAGGRRLWSSDKGVPITLSELVALLRPHLKTEFQGRIKVYACNSGTANWNNADPAPLIQQFADEMWDEGFRSCTFFGYVESLSTYVLESNHRYGMESGRRASELRIQVLADRKPS